MFTITKRGMLAHQICYVVTILGGPTNTLRTLRAAQKWGEKMDREMCKDCYKTPCECLASDASCDPE